MNNNVGKEDPPKKKRGRPRKSTKDDVAGKEEPPKKKRGRPPKSASNGKS